MFSKAVSAMLAISLPFKILKANKKLFKKKTLK